MADRTSAGIFGNIFKMLAEEPNDNNKKWALYFWEQSGEYDFSPYQMYADEALIELGLARMIPACGGTNNLDADNLPEIIYYGEEEF